MVRDVTHLQQLVDDKLHELVSKYGGSPGLIKAFPRAVEEAVEGAEVVQQGNNMQWEVRVGHLVVFASVRVAMTQRDAQRRMRETVQTVRFVLLSHGAHRLHELRHGKTDLRELAADFRDEIDDPDPKGKGKGCTCSRCDRPLRVDHLGGRHMCRVIAKFRCSTCGRTFTSQRGRFDPKEERVLDQYCAGPACGKCKCDVVSWEHVSEEAVEALQRRRDAAQLLQCQRVQRQARVAAKEEVGPDTWGDSAFDDGPGEPVSGGWKGINSKGKGKGKNVAKGVLTLPGHGRGKWQVVSGVVAVEDTEREQTVVPRLVTQEHRSDLCEPCRKWGDCSGWFADPFFVLAAARFLVEQEEGHGTKVCWEDVGDGFELTGTHCLGGIRLMMETRSL
mmetsp:Transcript_26971/g.62898  ORF Transcript_26971/g.62898 Transcript_26971/m.62898 type:complete len:390 (-) Transcript_26971:130-1299(-)